MPVNKTQLTEYQLERLMRELNENSLPLCDIASNFKIATSRLKQIATEQGFDLEGRQVRILEERLIEGLQRELGSEKFRYLLECLRDSDMSFVDVERETGLSYARVQRLAKVYGIVKPRNMRRLDKEQPQQSKNDQRTVLEETMSGDGRSLVWLSIAWR